MPTRVLRLMRSRRIRHLVSLALIAMVTSTGCQVVRHTDHPLPPTPPVGGDLPRELSKVILPTYRIEPPDILLIEALNMVPKPPYRLRAMDILHVSATGTIEQYPIESEYAIEPGGRINLGIPYGQVAVAGMTVDEAREAILKHLQATLTAPDVQVKLLQAAGMQPISGEHLVTPDGMVNLGTYGMVSVVGLTVPEAKAAIEKHLEKDLDKPEVAVDVWAYNSKVYYVITEGAGLGDSITRFPVTGNETVLDAIANINGITEVSSKKIWIARPSPHCDEVQILPVDYRAITAQGQTVTNYQVLPGDRVFVAEDKMVAFDTSLGKLLAPFERIMGFSILTVGTLSRFSGKVLFNNNQRGGFGGGGF